MKDKKTETSENNPNKKSDEAANQSKEEENNELTDSNPTEKPDESTEREQTEHDTGKSNKEFEPPLKRIIIFTTWIL